MWPPAWSQPFCFLLVFLMMTRLTDGQITYPLQLVVWPVDDFSIANYMEVNNTAYESFKQCICVLKRDRCIMGASIFKGNTQNGDKENILTLDKTEDNSGAIRYYTCKQFPSSEITRFELDCFLSHIPSLECGSDIMSCSQIPAIKCQNDNNNILLTWISEQSARILNYDQNEMDVSTCCSSGNTSSTIPPTTSTTTTTTTTTTTPTTVTTTSHTATTSTTKGITTTTTSSSVVSSSSSPSIIITTPTASTTTPPKTGNGPGEITVYVGIGVGAAAASVIVTSVVCALLLVKRRRSAQMSDLNQDTGIGSNEKDGRGRDGAIPRLRRQENPRAFSQASVREDDYDCIGSDPGSVDDGYERIQESGRRSKSEVLDSTDETLNDVDGKDDYNEINEVRNDNAEYIIPIDDPYPYYAQLESRNVDDDNDYLTPVVPSNNSSTPALPPRPHNIASNERQS